MKTVAERRNTKRRKVKLRWPSAGCATKEIKPNIFYLLKLLGEGAENRYYLHPLIKCVHAFFRVKRDTLCL